MRSGLSAFCESMDCADGRLVLRFFHASMVNGRVAFDGLVPIDYIDG
jgi:hypothetical protein